MNRARRTLLRRWPWRRYEAALIRYEIAGVAIRSAIIDVVEHQREAAATELAKTIATARHVDAFPWDTIRKHHNHDLGFTRDVVIVGASARREIPCLPWRSGAHWKGLKP